MLAGCGFATFGSLRSPLALLPGVPDVQLFLIRSGEGQGGVQRRARRRRGHRRTSTPDATTEELARGRASTGELAARVAHHGELAARAGGPPRPTRPRWSGGAGGAARAELARGTGGPPHPTGLMLRRGNCNTEPAWARASNWRDLQTILFAAAHAPSLAARGSCVAGAARRFGADRSFRSWFAAREKATYTVFDASFLLAAPIATMCPSRLGHLRSAPNLEVRVSQCNAPSPRRSPGRGTASGFWFTAAAPSPRARTCETERVDPDLDAVTLANV